MPVFSMRISILLELRFGLKNKAVLNEVRLRTEAKNIEMGLEGIKILLVLLTRPKIRVSAGLQS